MSGPPIAQALTLVPRRPVIVVPPPPAPSRRTTQYMTAAQVVSIEQLVRGNDDSLYEQVITQIEKEIQLTATQGFDSWLVYEVPPFSFASFSQPQAVVTATLVKHFSEHGFKARQIDDTTLYVSWTKALDATVANRRY